MFPDGIREATRQTLLTLWNVHSFFTTYADLDGWEPAATPAPPTHVLDRWMLSELDDTVAAVTDALEGFDALGGATRLARFVDDLSNWYVRRSRPRFWKASDPAAHATLHECLVTVAQLLAPFCPFLADEIHTTLTGARSVHLTDWPEPQGRHDPALAEQMAAARRLVGLGRAARTDAKVKVRQPLSRALLLHAGADLDEDVDAEIRSELNVKTLERLDTLSGLMRWNVVPNFRSLGPRLGPRVNEVKAALAAADGSELQAALERDGSIEIAGEKLTADDVDVRAERHDDLALVEDDGWAVALDLELDDALRAEGTARELVRALNDARKAAGLAIADRVQVTIDADDALRAVIDAHRAYIAAEVLATEIVHGAGDRRLELDGTSRRRHASTRSAELRAASASSEPLGATAVRSDGRALAAEALVVVEVGLEEAAHGGVGLVVAVAEEPLLGLLRLGVEHRHRRGGRPGVGHRRRVRQLEERRPALDGPGMRRAAGSGRRHRGGRRVGAPAPTSGSASASDGRRPSSGAADAASALAAASAVGRRRAGGGGGHVHRGAWPAGWPGAAHAGSSSTARMRSRAPASDARWSSR